MKKQIVTLALALACLTVHAQKTIERNFDHNDRYIELKVPFANDIQIKTWDKQTVYFKAELSTEDNQFLELYELDVFETSGALTITAKPEDIFEAMYDAWKSENKGKKKRSYYHTQKDYEFNYTLYVPKNAQFRVSSINGDMKAEVVDGNLTADLINGNIEIDRFSGNLDLSTINGEIDLKVAGGSMVAETIHGDIYADEGLQLASSDRHVGQKVSQKISNATTQLRLNTINGNMYLRK